MQQCASIGHPKHYVLTVWGFFDTLKAQFKNELGFLQSINADCAVFLDSNGHIILDVI